LRISEIVALAFVILILWLVGEFVLGFVWSLWMFGLGGKPKEFVEAGHALGGTIPWIGLLQGLFGALYQGVMLFVRKGHAWSNWQSFRDGLVVAIPVTIIWLLPVAQWPIVGWLFFPVSGVLISYICAYIVNHDIALAYSRNGRKTS
jgi:hypothetical protein